MSDTQKHTNSTGRNTDKWSKFWNQISSVLCSRYRVWCIHSQHEHKKLDIWFQNLLHVKKDCNVDVWTQQLYQ